MVDKVIKSHNEWRDLLTREQFHVTRRGGTERAFTGAYHDCKTPGIYLCICCEAELFHSDTKFDSRTGWPSFWQPIHDQAVDEKEDRTLWMARTEVICQRCDAHLGHVFPDGPEPTGQRYCMNSAALKLMAKPDPKPGDE